MNISIICSSIKHPVNEWIEEWISKNKDDHAINLYRSSSELTGGDILFLISCSDIIAKEYRDLYKKCLVLHASDLPDGKGWSPHVWQILEGKEKIILSLIEAEDAVDSGDIWRKELVNIPKHSDFGEINELLFSAEMALVDFAIKNFETIRPQKQKKIKNPVMYKKREPNDSEINTDLSIKDQFDLLRISDPDNYPAFFKLHGHAYKIWIKKNEK